MPSACREQSREEKRMKMRVLICSVSVALVSAAAHARASDLNVVGHVNVASNLTAGVVTLQGAAELAEPVLDFAKPGLFYRFTLTGDTSWVFTNHVAGRDAGERDHRCESVQSVQRGG
jgi:hypothetical protein